jgi:hypothetical protein
MCATTTRECRHARVPVSEAPVMRHRIGRPEHQLVGLQQADGAAGLDGAVPVVQARLDSSQRALPEFRRQGGEEGVAGSSPAEGFDGCWGF